MFNWLKEKYPVREKPYTYKGHEFTIKRCRYSIVVEWEGRRKTVHRHYRDEYYYVDTAIITQVNKFSSLKHAVDFACESMIDSKSHSQKLSDELNKSTAILTKDFDELGGW